MRIEMERLGSKRTRDEGAVAGRPACASDTAFGIVYNTAEGIYIMRSGREAPGDCLYNICITRNLRMELRGSWPIRVLVLSCKAAVFVFMWCRDFGSSAIDTIRNSAQGTKAARSQSFRPAVYMVNYSHVVLDQLDLPLGI